MTTTTGKTSAKTPKALTWETPDLGTHLKTTIVNGDGTVRVAAPTDDKDATRRLQKKVQAVAYANGFNANYRVTREVPEKGVGKGKWFLVGTPVDASLPRDRRPGTTPATKMSPPSRGTTTKKVEAKPAPVVRKARGKKVTATPQDMPKNLVGAGTKVVTPETDVA